MLVENTREGGITNIDCVPFHLHIIHRRMILCSIVSVFRILFFKIQNPDFSIVLKDPSLCSVFWCNFRGPLSKCKAQGGWQWQLFSQFAGSHNYHASPHWPLEHNTWTCSHKQYKWNTDCVTKVHVKLKWCLFLHLLLLYWDLCIDHLYFQHPENTEIVCSCVLALILQDRFLQ